MGITQIAGKLLAVHNQLQGEMQETIKLLRLLEGYWDDYNNLVEKYNNKCENIRELSRQLVDLCNEMKIAASKD